MPDEKKNKIARPANWRTVTLISLTMLTALAWSATLRAQSDPASFQHLTIEQGLSQNSVFCILQDSKGFMWFGTEDGLNKYDGYLFNIYRHDAQDPKSLADNPIRTIYEDRSGTLWVGTRGGGLNRFERQTESFTHYRNDAANPDSLSNDEVFSIYEDEASRLWVGTLNGLNRFDREKARFIHYQNNRADPNSLSSNNVISIYEDRSGTLSPLR